jgi:hypothetical protein
MESQSFFGDASGDQFARIDLISNHTVFKNQEHYRALVRGKDLPISTFSSFIHEATHHWCFVSPVGTALSLLYLSVAKKALQWTVTGDEGQMQEALDDLCAFDIAVRWLRPLNEGLAQFAEYDVLPPKSSLISPPLVATLTHLFNLPRRLAEAPKHDPTPAYYQLTDDINRWRLSRQTIERKSELLLQPIDAEGSGYLLGYLTVKQLWKSSARWYEQLNEADVFLMFIRKFVYADYSLVAEILDRKRSPFQRGARFGQHLYNILYAIWWVTFDDDVPWSEWEAILSTSKEKPGHWLEVADPKIFAALDTKKLVRKGRKLQAKYFREVAEPVEFASADVKLPFPSDYFIDVISERHLMWLGEMNARWESKGHQIGRVVADDGIVYDNVKLTNTSSKDLNELELDIYVDLYSDYQLTTLGNERGVFGFAARGQTSEHLTSDLLKKRLDRRRTSELTGLVHQVVGSYLVGTNYRENLENFWKDGGLGLLNDTYSGFASGFNDHTRATVNENGLADLLENDGNLVRNVAAITLASSAGLSPEGLSSYSNMLLDPLSAVKRVEKLWPEKDSPLASIDSDGFLSSSF